MSRLDLTETPPGILKKNLSAIHLEIVFMDAFKNLFSDGLEKNPYKVPLEVYQRIALENVLRMVLDILPKFFQEFPLEVSPEISPRILLGNLL